MKKWKKLERTKKCHCSSFLSSLPDPAEPAELALGAVYVLTSFLSVRPVR